MFSAKYQPTSHRLKSNSRSFKIKCDILCILLFIDMFKIFFRTKKKPWNRVQEKERLVVENTISQNDKKSAFLYWFFLLFPISHSFFFPFKYLCLNKHRWMLMIYSLHFIFTMNDHWIFFFAFLFLILRLQHDFFGRFSISHFATAKRSPTGAEKSELTTDIFEIWETLRVGRRKKNQIEVRWRDFIKNINFIFSLVFIHDIMLEE